MKKISFIIPMYNAGEYVGNCINSIYNQGFTEEEFEIIVVDDGSVDDGSDIVQRYDKVKYIYQENRGQASARNVGLEHAAGLYVCFVDSDDALVPNSLGLVLRKAMEVNLEMLTYDMLIGGSEIACGEDLSKIVSGSEYIENNNYNNGPWWYVVRKDCIGDLRFVEGRYGEDGMFTMELLMKVKRVAHVDRHCYYYIRRDGSTTTRRDVSHMKKMVDDYLFVYHYMKHLVEKYRHNLSDRAMKRCLERSESYLFFLLVRLLRIPNSANLIKETVKKMGGAYPIKRLNKRDYPGVTYSVMHIIVNRPWLMILVNSMCNFLK